MTSTSQSVVTSASQSSVQPALLVELAQHVSGCTQILSLDPAPGNGPALWGTVAAMWDGSRLTLTEATELRLTGEEAEMWVRRRIAAHDRGPTVVLVEDTCTGPALFHGLGDVEVYRVTPRVSKLRRLELARECGVVCLAPQVDWSDFRLIAGLPCTEAVRGYSHVLDAVSQAVLWCVGTWRFYNSYQTTSGCR